MRIDLFLPNYFDEIALLHEMIGFRYIVLAEVFQTFRYACVQATPCIMGGRVGFSLRSTPVTARGWGQRTYHHTRTTTNVS